MILLLPLSKNNKKLLIINNGLLRNPRRLQARKTTDHVRNGLNNRLPERTSPFPQRNAVRYFKQWNPNGPKVTHGLRRSSCYSLKPKCTILCYLETSKQTLTARTQQSLLYEIGIRQVYSSNQTQLQKQRNQCQVACQQSSHQSQVQKLRKSDWRLQTSTHPCPWLSQGILQDGQGLHCPKEIWWMHLTA